MSAARGRKLQHEGLHCVECDRASDRYERFRAYLTVDDEVAVYCPDCAERAFGGEVREHPEEIA